MEQKSTLIIEVNARNAERNTQRLVIELRNLQNSTTNVTNNLTQMERQSSQTSNAFRTLATQMAGIVTVGAAIAKVDAYTNLQNRLKLVTSSQSELNQAMRDTFAIAQNTASAWDSTAMVYQRFASNAERLGISLTQVAGLTETVAKAISISGASASSAEAALMQFGQALASGVLRGEEFNSIAEQAPALLNAIALGLDTDIGKLRAMAAEGKITGDALVQALTKAKDSTDELFNSTDFTIANEFTRLSNAVTQFVGEANKGTGAASILGSAIKTLSENLQTIADAAIIGGVALLTKTIVAKTTALIASTTATFADTAAATANAQAQLAQAVAAQNLARSELAATAAMVKSMGVTNAQTAAMVANARAKYQAAAANVALAQSQVAANAAAGLGARALAAVVSPMGILTIAATAAAGAYIYFKNKSAEATAELERQTDVAKKTTEELKALKGAQRDAAIADLKEAFKGQNEELQKLDNQFNGWVRSIRNSKPYSEELNKLVQQVQNGFISQADALERLNKMKVLTDEQRKQGLSYVNNAELQRDKTVQVEKALKAFGIEVKLAGNASDNAAAQHRNQAGALDDTAEAAKRAKDALNEYTKKMIDAGKLAMVTNTLLNEGYSLEVARDLAEQAVKNGKVTKEEAQAILFKNEQEAMLKSNLDARTESQRNATKASKDQAKADKGAAKAAERLAEAAAELSSRYRYDFSTAARKMALDLQKQISDINMSDMGASEKSDYIQIAKARYDAMLELYKVEQVMELAEHRLTEEEKLRYSFNIAEKRLKANTDLSNDEKKVYKQSLDERFKAELSVLERTQVERLLDAQQAFITEKEYSERKLQIELDALTELEEKEKAANIRLGKSDAELQATKLKNALLTQKLIEENRKFFEKRDEAASSYGSLLDDLAPKGELEKLREQLTERQKVVEEAYEAGIIQQEEYYARMRQIEEDYWFMSSGYQLKIASDIFGGLSGVMLNFVDESSSAYQALVAAQKTANLASVFMNNLTAMSAAWASAPFPYNLPAVATTALETGVLQATLQAFTPTRGFKTGGYTGNVPTNQVAGVVHGQEYVMNAQATKRIGVDTLKAIESGRAPATSGGQANVELNPNFVIVDERESLSDYLYSSDGKKAFVKFFKRNKAELGVA